MPQVDLEALKNKLENTIEVAQRKLDAINLILGDFPIQETNLFNSVSTSNNNNNNPVKNNSDNLLSPQFPAKGRSENQIGFLFDNLINKGVQMADIKKIYDKCIFQTGGEAKRVDNAVRKMVRLGKLIQVKYNENNKECYYGLPSWLGEEDFKADRKPVNAPSDIENVEISSDEQQ